MRSHHVIGLFALATLTPACSGSPSDPLSSTSSFSPSASAPRALPSVRPGVDEQWRAKFQKKPTPRDGCFTATPGVDHEWREVACGEAPVAPLARQKGVLAPVQLGHRASAQGVPSTPLGAVSGSAMGGGRAPAPELVGGGGGDDTAVAQLLTGATGKFPSVAGGASESDNQSGANHQGSNSYTLQMNTNFWPSGGVGAVPSQCAGSTNPGCSGVQQFVYDALAGQMYIEYTLANFGPVQGCPSGFTEYPNYTTSTTPDCFFNTKPVGVPSVLPENLQSEGVVMTATTNGTSDTLEMWVSGVPYTLTWPSVLGLATGWTTAEFNIFGDSGGTQAVFSSETTMEVEVLLDSATPTRAAPGIFSPTPSCPSCGTVTVETNTMSLIGNPCAFGGDHPGIQFLESNQAQFTGQNPAVPACPALTLGASTISIPLGTANQVGASVVGALVDQSLNGGLQPETCQVSGVNGSATIGTVYPQLDPQIVFSLPAESSVSSWQQAVTCDVGGPAVVETVDGTANPFYPSPATISIAAGGDYAMVSLLFTNQDPYCDAIWYSGTLQPAQSLVTTNFQPASDLVMVSAAWNTPPGNYTLAIESDGCNDSVSNFTTELPIQVTKCIPITECYSDSCQGTISNGCGGILNCPSASSCTSPNICMAGQCGVCPAGEVYDATAEECVSKTPVKPPPGGCKGTTCM